MEWTSASSLFLAAYEARQNETEIPVQGTDESPMEEDEMLPANNTPNLPVANTHFLPVPQSDDAGPSSTSQAAPLISIGRTGGTLPPDLSARISEHMRLGDVEVANGRPRPAFPREFVSEIRAAMEENRNVPRAPGSEPYIPWTINFGPLNAVEKRIMKRQPINTWAVLSLKKSTLRRFLRCNGQRYKSRDHKNRLVGFAATLMRLYQERERDPLRRRETQLRLQAAQRVRREASTTMPTLPQQVVLMALPEDDPEQPHSCPGPNCTCVVTLAGLLRQDFHHLTTASLDVLRGMTVRSKDELEGFVRRFGAQPNSPHCRTLLLKQIRDLLVNEDAAKDEVLHRQTLEVLAIQAAQQDAAGRPTLAFHCRICKEGRPDGMLLPCGHSRTCEDCARTLSRCPECFCLVTGVFKMFFPTV